MTMERFEDNAPTRKEWRIHNVMLLVDTAPEQFASYPDFMEEKTLECQLCWKCGPRDAQTSDGTKVREPRLAIFCECPRPSRPPPIPADALCDSPFDMEIW